MAEIHSFPHVIAQQRKAKAVPEARQWICRRCENDTGVSTSELIQTVTAPRVKAGKLAGGTKRWICRACNQRGVTTIAP